MSESAKMTGDASWAPVFCSVAVFPGIGQWMQRRRNAGTFYAGVFLFLAVMFTWVLIVYLKQAIPVIRDALAGVPLEGRELPPLRAILMPFAVVMFIYIANVVDVLRGRLQLKKAGTAPKTST